MLIEESETQKYKISDNTSTIDIDQKQSIETINTSVK